MTGRVSQPKHFPTDLEHLVVQVRTHVTEFEMKGDTVHPIKFRPWHADALMALRHMRGLKSCSARPMASEAQAAARQLLDAAACYHAVSALAGPEDYWELCYLQRVEYRIYAHIAALHRLGYALRWAQEPDSRSVIFAFVPKRRAKPAA